MKSTGFILVESYPKNKFLRLSKGFVLAFSDNEKELEVIRDRLISNNVQRKIRFDAVKNVIENYFYWLGENSVEQYVNENPIPNEILEFVTYGTDRNESFIFSTKEDDFNVEFNIENVIGHKMYGSLL